MSGLPDAAAWDFQVRAVTGGGARTESMLWDFGAPAVVGPDGIPQLHRFYDGEGGRIWRLGASLTVIEVPTDLVVGVSDHYSDGAFGVSDAESGDWILVDAETAREVEFEGGIVGNKPPCGPASERNRALFDQMRASVRLQPIVR